MKKNSTPEFLKGGSEMASAIMNFNWSKTPLGIPGQWPQILKSTVTIMLANRFPMVLCWGGGLIQIYNDAYISMLGNKHPKSLGQGASDCWSETWNTTGPLIQMPFNGGSTTWMENISLEIKRNDFIEETHFNIAYSPVPDDTAVSGIGGVLGIGNETSTQIIGERRIILLRDVALASAKARTSIEACLNAAICFSHHSEDIPFALFYLLTPDKKHVHLVATSGIGKGDLLNADIVNMKASAAGKDPWNLYKTLQQEKLQVVVDLKKQFKSIPKGPWSNAPQSAVVIPLCSNKAHDYVGFLVCGISSRLQYDEQYQHFFNLLSAQICTALSTAAVIEEEQKHAAILAHEILEQVKEKEQIKNNELRLRNFTHELESEVKTRTVELEETRQTLLQNNIELKQKNQELNLTKELLNSEYARSLIEASLDPLITISAAGKITDMNEAMATITGKTRADLIGSEFANYFTDPQKAREIYQEVFEKGFVTNYPLVIIDGKLTDVLFNGSLYKDEKGKVLGAVVVARDITEQKRFEKELTEAKNSAEDATEKAENAKIKAETAVLIAEDAVKSKQRFLSNMSHEIRTPLNAVVGFTNVLLKTKLSEKQNQYLAAIKLSGDTLTVLINDVLDLAKVDAGKMTFEQVPFRMASSVTSLIHLFETEIYEKNLELIVDYDNDIPDTLLGDPLRLQQVILNLVSNSVKFTSIGKITVTVRLLKQNSNNVTIEFSVADTGIGIEENKIDHIFDDFHQAATSTARLYGGTGLGLSIAKQLIKQQGGTIEVTSKLDEGSTFSFTLSFKKTTATFDFENDQSEPNQEIKNIRVLVVEDMPLNQLLMKTLMDDFGFKCDIAGNGEIAIEKLRENDYDVILMDLQMPVMNGFEATEYIRHSMNCNTSIIALTADVTTVDLKKCKAVGMNDYISKPVDEQVLHTKIVNLYKKNIAAVGNSRQDAVDGKIEKCTDLNYLNSRTKSNPKLMMEMISLYLEQTPTLIRSMRQSWQDADWDGLQASVHKMIPSFSIMGISADFENMAKMVKDYAQVRLQSGGIEEMVKRIEQVCVKSCIELEEELKSIKKNAHAKRN